MGRCIVVTGIVCDQDYLVEPEILLGRETDTWRLLGGFINDRQKALKLLNKLKYSDSYFHSQLRNQIRKEANILINSIENVCYLSGSSRRSPRMITGDGDQYVYLEYICQYNQGICHPGGDIVELRWMKKNELYQLELAPQTEKTFQELSWL